MTPEEQRIAIAEACGWLDIQRCGRSSLKPHADGAEYRGTKDAPSVNYAREYVRLPNYLNDLNAMNEAEISLRLEKRAEYLNRLSDIVGNDSMAGFPTDDDDATRWLWNIHVATAAQRAEAFLRTIGKWKD